jgi:hypothetical protein
MRICTTIGVKDAITHCAFLVAFYERVYQPNHPLTGLQQYTLGNLYGETAGHAARAVQHIENAMRILRVTHGTANRLFRRLVMYRQKLQRLIMV